jgi:hypothetical protein
LRSLNDCAEPNSCSSGPMSLSISGSTSMLSMNRRSTHGIGGWRSSEV